MPLACASDCMRPICREGRTSFCRHGRSQSSFTAVSGTAIATVTGAARRLRDRSSGIRSLKEIWYATGRFRPRSARLVGGSASYGSAGFARPTRTRRSSRYWRGFETGRTISKARSLENARGNFARQDCYQTWRYVNFTPRIGNRLVCYQTWRQIAFTPRIRNTDDRFDIPAREIETAHGRHANRAAL